MVERNQRAFTRPALGTFRTSGRLVCVPDELRPEAIHGLRPGLEKWVRHIAQERRTRVEISDINSLELKPFASEVTLEEVHDGTFRYTGVVDRLEVGQDLL